jgi:putative DNA primase/helicase
VPDEFLTELGNSDRLVSQHRHEMRWVLDQGNFITCRPSGLWRVDNEAVYTWQKEIARSLWNLVATADPAQRAQIIKFCIESERKAKIGASVDLSKSHPEIAIRANQLDTNPMLAGVPDGAVDLKTGACGKANPSDLITKSLAVNPSPGPCPIWTAFLHRIMDGDEGKIAYLQKISGVCLTGIVSVQEFWIFHGLGANGKSVFVDTAIEILGDYACIAPPGLIASRAFDDHPTEIADSIGRRLLVTSETEDGARLKSQSIKRFTGDAKLKGRFMRQDYIEFARTFKLWLVTNNPPIISEPSNAIWRRVRMIPFNVTIPASEQDPALLEKLRGEWPQILAWMIEGCLAWQREGMKPPPEVLAATAAYQSEQDALTDFVGDRCALGANFKVSRNDVFNSYLSWATQTGEKHPFNRNSFLAQIRRLPGVNDFRWRPLGCNDPVRGFSGLKTKGVSDSDTDTAYRPYTHAHEQENGNGMSQVAQVTRAGNGEAEFDYESAERTALSEGGM